MSRCDSAAIVSNTSELLPEPDTPVNTVSRRFGISTWMSLRLFTRAPWTRIRSWLSAACDSDAVRWEAMRVSVLRHPDGSWGGVQSSGSFANSRLVFLYQPMPLMGCFHRPFMSFRAVSCDVSPAATASRRCWSWALITSSAVAPRSGRSQAPPSCLHVIVFICLSSSPVGVRGGRADLGAPRPGCPGHLRDRATTHRSCPASARQARPEPGRPLDPWKARGMTDPAPAGNSQVSLLVPHPGRTAVLVADVGPGSEAAPPPMLPTLRVSGAEPSLSDILASVDVIDTARTAALRLVMTSPVDGRDVDDAEDGEVSLL